MTDHVINSSYYSIISIIGHLNNFWFMYITESLDI